MAGVGLGPRYGVLSVDNNDRFRLSNRYITQAKARLANTNYS